jgi:hypothetical protein
LTGNMPDSIRRFSIWADLPPTASFRPSKQKRRSRSILASPSTLRCAAAPPP